MRFLIVAAFLAAPLPAFADVCDALRLQSLSMSELAIAAVSARNTMSCIQGDSDLPEPIATEMSDAADNLTNALKLIDRDRAAIQAKSETCR